MMDDDMGNEDNITLKTLAKAAIADNNSNAKDFLEKTKVSLNMISEEELQTEIDSLK